MGEPDEPRLIEVSFKISSKIHDEIEKICRYHGMSMEQFLTLGCAAARTFLEETDKNNKIIVTTFNWFPIKELTLPEV